VGRVRLSPAAPRWPPCRCPAVPRCRCAISRRQKPGDAIDYVIVVDKLAPVGLRNAFTHSVNKEGLAFEQAGNGVFDQLLSILAICMCHLLKPRFNIGCEIYFHALRLSQYGQRSKLRTYCGKPALSNARSTHPSGPRPADLSRWA
jgi:hypothetical protein